MLPDKRTDRGLPHNPPTGEDTAFIGDLLELFSTDYLGSRIGVRILEASAERVVGTMPVEGNTQPYGLLHGGASAVLAETLGSVGAILHGGSSRTAVGVDLNCTHHRSVRSGLVTGIATPLHRGRTTATYAITISDAQNRRVCSSRLTCQLRQTNERHGPAQQADCTGNTPM
ncbi:hotdog fold thioesterase [Streptomyces rhizosphaericus]|uniref:hotdog fold thioesterase n=1 Tax=Streptomyces rhizosphaericus TaxID=114699 RepID=UPI000A37C770|nr:hotdog fold thioesterase [Streptomyces rhizosphaericus]